MLSDFIHDYWKIGVVIFLLVIVLPLAYIIAGKYNSLGAQVDNLRIEGNFSFEQAGETVQGYDVINYITQYRDSDMTIVVLTKETTEDPESDILDGYKAILDDSDDWTDIDDYDIISNATDGNDNTHNGKSYFGKGYVNQGIDDDDYINENCSFLIDPYYNTSTGKIDVIRFIQVN